MKIIFFNLEAFQIAWKFVYLSELQKICSSFTVNLYRKYAADTPLENKRLSAESTKNLLHQGTYLLKPAYLHNGFQPPNL
mgnify:CR=1 FL=1